MIYEYVGAFIYCVRTLRQEINKLVKLLLTTKGRDKIFKAKVFQSQTQTTGKPSSRLNLLCNLLRRLTLKEIQQWYNQ